MRFVYAAGTCVAAAMLFNLTSAAQEPAQPRGPAPAPGAAAQQERKQADAQAITLTGCVQSESDFRRAQDAGKGGVAGTGIGVGNEFILIDASIGSTASGAPGAADAPDAAGKPTGTAGVAAAAASYELTGPNEGQVANHVGKRVEIVGTLKPAEVGASGPTGGPTAGAPPRGVDVVSQDLKLRELDVISVREASGTCQASR